MLLTKTHVFWSDLLKFCGFFFSSLLSKGIEKFKTRSGIYWLTGTILKSVCSKMERSCNFSYTCISNF